LSKNLNTIHLLKKNQDKIDWFHLSKNPNAIHILEQTPDKINWYNLSSNPSIFKLDYEAMLLAFEPIAREIIEYVWHPSRMDRWPEPAFENCSG